MRGITLFPPEKGFPRVTAPTKLISVLIFERILTVFLWDVIMCFIWEEEFYVKRS